jgi:hypothetical protein
MGEAFLCRRGGDTTIEHITATNATSLTFNTTNHKNAKCMVFGVVTTTRTDHQYAGGPIVNTNTQRYMLRGNVYDNYWTNSDTGDPVGIDINQSGAFTRNTKSIALKVGTPAYGLEYSDTYRITNTIDIYVVDYS